MDSSDPAIAASSGYPWSFIDPEWLWIGAGLIGSLLVGVLLIQLVERWRKRSLEEEPGPDAENQLAAFRAMYEQGNLSQQEFERIRRLLTPHAQQTGDALPPPPPQAPPQESGGSSA